MMSVRIQAQGEPDMLPCIRDYSYGTADEVVFFSGEKVIQERLNMGMKINTGEALTLYCAHVVRGIRLDKPDQEIRDEASEILNTDNVMIGVPETLRAVSILANVDNRNERHITLRNPISTNKCLNPGGLLEDDCSITE